MNKPFPVIDPVATGANILRLRQQRGYSVRDLQNWFGFEEPQAIYKWQKGKSLPSVDNLYALGTLLEVPMDQILVASNQPIQRNGQQEPSCCPLPLPGGFEYGKDTKHAAIFPQCPTPPYDRLPRRMVASHTGEGHRFDHSVPSVGKGLVDGCICALTPYVFRGVG